MHLNIMINNNAIKNFGLSEFCSNKNRNLVRLNEEINEYIHRYGPRFIYFVRIKVSSN